MNKFKPILGIDLGTTNSCVGYSENHKTVNIITYPNGSRTVPSIVLIKESGKVVEVGHKAIEGLLENPANTINAVKRLMGRTFQELKDLKLNIVDSRYKIVAGKNDTAAIEIEGKVYTPIEISAMILSYLKKQAENYTNTSIEDAIITVPAYFNDAQRQATKDAATIAGLNCLRVLNEPTAAALAYGVQNDIKSGKVCVYDFGGGTFDVTCLKIEDGVYEVLSTHGDTHLGGEDIDMELAKYIVDKWKAQYNIALTNEALSRIQDAAKVAKETCSQSDVADINLPFLAVDENNKPVHFKLQLKENEVRKIAEKYVEKTKRSIDQVLKDAKETVSTIDRVILVGGSTRLPAVQEMIKKYFGKDGFININPDEAIAMGAALQGASINTTISDKSDILLLDVTSLSLGIETQGNVNTIMIKRNTTIPTSYSQIFSTAMDNQTAVTVNIYQGERTMAADCKLLGTFELTGIKAAPRGVPQIEVTFDIDKDGIVNVSAIDKATGNKQTATIDSATGLSEEEIEKMVKDAEIYKESDALKARLVSIENQKDHLISKYEGLNEDQKQDVVSELYSEIKAIELNADANELDKAEEKLRKFAEELYKIEQKSNNDKDKENDNPDSEGDQIEKE